jgi:hypothetical protein
MNNPQALPTQALESATPVPAKRGLKLIFLVAAVILVLAWYASTKRWYLPGDDLGYNLGLVGGSMMLLLLLYPLRKHIRSLRRAGGIHHWFRIHMLLGIFGPLLVVAHSTFYIGSLNAGVAMFCMLLVASSGVVGRFMYARIHHGLYGRKASLDDMQETLGIQSSEVRSKFHFAPAVEAELKAFNEQALRRSPGLLSGAWKFMTLALRARFCRARCHRELRQVMRHHATQRQWNKAKLQERLAAADRQVGDYLTAVRHTAQFRAYERLFSLWHILHVPFVFMLIISGVVHVVYVHMY